MATKYLIYLCAAHCGNYTLEKLVTQHCLVHVWYMRDPRLVGLAIFKRLVIVYHRYPLYQGVPRSPVPGSTTISCTREYHYPLYQGVPLSPVPGSTTISCTREYHYLLYQGVPLSPVPGSTTISCTREYHYPLYQGVPLSPVPGTTPIPCIREYPYLLYWGVPLSPVPKAEMFMTMFEQCYLRNDLCYVVFRYPHHPLTNSCSLCHAGSERNNCS